MNRFQLAIIAVTVAAIPSLAEASPRLYSAKATPIYRQNFTVTTTAARTFATSDLRAWSGIGCSIADTFMVVRRPNGSMYANDDCSSSTRASCVTAPGQIGTWVVTVFAAPAKPLVPGNTKAAALGIPQPDPGRCGFANLTMNGARLETDLMFGGDLITVPDDISGTFRIQTVHQSGGADDTTLYAYGPNWNQIFYDNDSGVGRAAAGVAALSQGSKILVGSYSFAGGGRTRLILNDCVGNPDASPDSCRNQGIDADGDNLSDALEGELGTDPDSHDTDRDGIWDYYETIGRIVGSDEVELPRFGANPRRRDIFLELDREERLPDAADPTYAIGELMTEDRVDLLLEDTYLDLPQMPPAPDGTRGIFVHVDSGVACPGRPTLCGDWGGSEVIPMTWDDLRIPPTFAQHFSVARRGIFHYGYMTAGGDGQSGSGETTLYVQSRRNLAHELGHSLGLLHWGAHDVPRLNSKINYPSLMSYLFIWGLPGIAPERGRFSEGTMPSLDGPVDERTWAASGPVAYLEERPLYYTIEGTTIDLDRDGRVSPFGTVHTDVAPLDRGTTGNDPWPHVVGATVLSQPFWATSKPTGGTALATQEILGARWIHAFVPALHSNGFTYPYYLQALAGAGAPQWSTPQQLPALFGLSHGEPAAEGFLNPNGAPSVLLVFPDFNGELKYLDMNPASPQSSTWQSIPGWPAGVTARQATLENLGDRVMMVWRDAGSGDVEDNVYSAAFDIATKTWSAIALEPITSRFTPGLARGNDGRVYLAYIEPVGRNGEIKLAYRPASAATGPWTRADTGTTDWALSQVPPDEARQRLSLELVPLRSSVEAVFPDGSAQLVVSWTRNKWEDGGSVQDEWQLYRATLTGYVSPAASTIEGKMWVRRLDKTGDRPVPSHSVGTAMNGPDMVAVYTATTWTAPGTLQGARFLPYASGVAPGFEGMLDTDDAIVIDAHMCTSVWNLLDGGAAACRCETGRACANLVPQPLAEEMTPCE